MSPQQKKYYVRLINLQGSLWNVFESTEEDDNEYEIRYSNKIQNPAVFNCTLENETFKIALLTRYVDSIPHIVPCVINPNKNKAKSLARKVTSAIKKMSKKLEEQVLERKSKRLGK